MRMNKNLHAATAARLLRLRPASHKIVLGLAALGLAATVSATAMAAAAPAAPVPPTAAQRADQYLQAQMAALRIPGMQVAVVKDGRIALLRHYGTASVEFSAPVTDQTVFAINSITKAFTGVAAMQLVQQGRLDLSKPVGDYLPELPQSWRGVSIRQLLSHTSGLPDVSAAPTVETDAAAAWAWVIASPIRFAPGERFDYCQTNYTLIQKVVNGIESRPPDAPLAAAQIAAAGMPHTSYGDAFDVIPNKAPTYRWRSPSLSNSWTEPATLLRGTSERFLPFRRASSGLNSTAEDMARWIIAIDGKQLLDAHSMETLWAPVAFNSGAKGQWGMGWQVLSRGAHRAVGMTGGGRAAFSIYPEDGVAVVILTNLTGSYPEDLIDKVASLYAPGLRLTGVPALRLALDDGGYARASEVAADIEARDGAVQWPEAELNDWAYRLLATGRRTEALAIFQLIVEKYPASPNAEDSLAQASLANGDKAAAMLHYRRVLELAPGNQSAHKHLADLSNPAK